jgi:hypothetical protein
VRQGEKTRPNNGRSFHRKSTPRQPYPYILCGLFLTPLTSRMTIRRVYCFDRATNKSSRAATTGGEHDAIFAGVDGAVHQSGMFRARALVAGASLRPQRGARILSQLRKFLAGRPATNWSPASHEAAVADSTATAAQAPIDLFVGVAPSYKGPEAICLRPFLLSIVRSALQEFFPRSA